MAKVQVLSIRENDFLTLIPKNLIKYLNYHDDFSYAYLPIELGESKYIVKQYWRELNNKDPAHIWFRKFIKKSFDIHSN